MDAWPNNFRLSSRREGQSKSVMYDSAPGLAASAGANSRRVAAFTKLAFEHAREARSHFGSRASVFFRSADFGFRFLLGIRSLLRQGRLGIFHQFLYSLGI